MLRNNELYFHSIPISFQIDDKKDFSDSKLVGILDYDGSDYEPKIGALNEISKFFWENLSKELKNNYREVDHFIFKSNNNGLFYKIAEEFGNDCEKSITDYNYCFLDEFDDYNDIIEFFYNENKKK